MLTQNSIKTSPQSHAKFFKFQIKRAKSPLLVDQKLNIQKQSLSLKRIKSAGKYKSAKEQNHKNSVFKQVESLQTYKQQQDKIKDLKGVFQKLRQKQQPVSLKERHLIQSQNSNQKCLQFSQKIRGKNGVKANNCTKQFNTSETTKFGQTRTQLIKEQKDKNTFLIQISNGKEQFKKKQSMKPANYNYVDQYELFSKISLRNCDATKIEPDSCHLKGHNQTADSANISSSLQKINKLQKQLLKKNQLVKILERRCAQNNMDGYIGLQRSKSINLKQHTVQLQIEKNAHTVSDNKLNQQLEKQNKDLTNHVYYLQKKCQARQRNNKIMKDQLQTKQKQIRNIQQNMLIAYQQNLRYMSQLQTNNKRIAQLQNEKDQFIKKSLDLQVSLQIVKQEAYIMAKKMDQQANERINKLKVVKVLQQCITLQAQTSKSLNQSDDYQNKQQLQFFDISRQLIKEQKDTKGISYLLQQKKLSSYDKICILQTNDQLPKDELYEKIYFQIGDLFSVAIQDDIYEYHNRLLDQIQQFKSTMAQLVKSIKILTQKLHESQQKQRQYQDQLRIIRCKAQKMTEQIQRGHFQLKNNKDLIQDQNQQILKTYSEKLNAKYKVLLQQR